MGDPRYLPKLRLMSKSCIFDFERYILPNKGCLLPAAKKANQRNPYCRHFLTYRKFFVYQPRKVARAASAAGAGFVITGAVAVSPAFTACDEMLLVLPGQFVVVLNFTMQDGAEALRTTRKPTLLPRPYG